MTLRRRYSEFASFREALVRLFPTLIIPPIPEKHSMCTYLHTLLGLMGQLIMLLRQEKQLKMSASSTTESACYNPF